jgi:protein TonB
LNFKEAAVFEDSVFESAGRIRTRSRSWMIAAFLFNGSILLALILIPLIYPQGLSRQAFPFLMATPAPTTPRQPLREPPAHPARGAGEFDLSPIFAPPKIPSFFPWTDRNGSVPGGNIQGADLNSGAGDDARKLFQGQAAIPIVQITQSHPLRVSGSVVEGLLVYKPTPRYSSIAIVTRTEGTVTLAATISKAGTIENLRVVSGPAMLQQAALDAVKNWRYRPYELDGQPIEVETTVNVIFKLGR